LQLSFPNILFPKPFWLKTIQREEQNTIPLAFKSMKTEWGHTKMKVGQHEADEHKTSFIITGKLSP
jgi:hypothetical protein